VHLKINYTSMVVWTWIQQYNRNINFIRQTGSQDSQIPLQQRQPHPQVQLQFNGSEFLPMTPQTKTFWNQMRSRAIFLTRLQMVKPKATSLHYRERQGPLTNNQIYPTDETVARRIFLRRAYGRLLSVSHYSIESKTCFGTFCIEYVHG
jgi:hypothetical protein